MSVSLDQLIQRVRQDTSMEYSEEVTDLEVTGYLNVELGELHDELTLRYEEYFTSSEDLYLTASVYELTSSTFKVMGVYKLNGSREVMLRKVGRQEASLSNGPTYFDPYVGRVPAYRIEQNRICFIPDDCVPGNVRLATSPVAPTLVSGSTDTLGWPYTMNHWEDYIVVGAAIRCLQKVDRDVSALLLRKQAIVQRIRSAASGRDASGLEGWQDTSEPTGWWY